jgi:hypothetical protein
MPNYRRAFVPGGCWFFTVNLFDRRRHLLTDCTGWSPASPVGRIRHFTATRGLACFHRIGRARSRPRAASASAFERARRNALWLIAPYGHGAKVRAPAAAMALIDQLK